MFNTIRSSCHAVAAHAKHVHIQYHLIPKYSASLPIDKILSTELDPLVHYIDHEEEKIQYLVILNTINFGSGYFPFLNKRQGRSGYFSIASCLTDYFKSNGPISSEVLINLSFNQVCKLFEQPPDNDHTAELMVYFKQALNDLGIFITQQFDSNFVNLIYAADSKAEKLVNLLLSMPFFNDIEYYQYQPVYFFKRAQIMVSDLSIAFQNKGLGHFDDLYNLTMFADNLAPHVLT